MANARSPLLYVFLALPVAYLLALVGFPIAYNVLMSVQEVMLGNIADFVRPFVGLDNYREAAADPAFRKVLVNSLLFVSVNVVGQIGIGLGVALFFAQKFPGAHYLRGLCCRPGCCRRWSSAHCGNGCSPPNTASSISRSPGCG